MQRSKGKRKSSKYTNKMKINFHLYRDHYVYSNRHCRWRQEEDFFSSPLAPQIKRFESHLAKFMDSRERRLKLKNTYETIFTSKQLNKRQKTVFESTKTRTKVEF